ncbi:MAG: nuclear transport factor 2 family protein [Rhodoferax sp.]|nr:nuclear transport factor 2 family protein [Rhodoferax sp.]
MPVISVTLLPGYSRAAEQRLVARVAVAARSVIAASSAGTTVFVQHANTYQRDGQVLGAGGAERPDASALVRAFLGLMQERKLAEAQAMLAPGFSMHFPGGTPMYQLDELVRFSSTRYRSVAKTFERFDECWTGEGAVVTCSGTLHGVWLDGSQFEGVRFLDRFDIRDGLIQRQDVWNDLALVMPAATTTA